MSIQLAQQPKGSDRSKGGVRKAVGLILLILVAIPTLNAAIWATGLAQAVLGDGVLEEIPKKVIRQAPLLLDDVFLVAQEPGAIDDPAARAWVEAAARTGRTPSQMLEKTGISKWLETDLAGAVADVVKAFRGDVDPSLVVLNLKPLRTALASGEIQAAVSETLANLPDCDQKKAAEWFNATHRADRLTPLPPCNPGISLMPGAVSAVMARLIDFPDEKRLVDRKEMPAKWGLDLIRTARQMLWLILLVPILMLLLAAAVADSSGRGLLKWSGAGALASGLSAFLTSFGIVQILKTLVDNKHFMLDLSERSSFWSRRMSTITADHSVTLVRDVISDLFAPVIWISGVIAVVGLGLLLLSYVVGRRGKEVAKTAVG